MPHSFVHHTHDGWVTITTPILNHDDEILGVRLRFHAPHTPDGVMYHGFISRANIDIALGESASEEMIADIFMTKPKIEDVGDEASEGCIFAIYTAYGNIKISVPMGEEVVDEESDASAYEIQAIIGDARARYEQLEAKLKRACAEINQLKQQLASKPATADDNQSDEKSSKVAVTFVMPKNACSYCGYESSLVCTRCNKTAVCQGCIDNPWPYAMFPKKKCACGHVLCRSCAMYCNSCVQFSRGAGNIYCDKCLPADYTMKCTVHKWLICPKKHTCDHGAGDECGCPRDDKYFCCY
jgi:hypothetical protein